MSPTMRYTKVFYLNLNKQIRDNKLNLGLNAFADEAGVSRSQLYDVLAGKKSPTTDWLDKCANVLGVPTYVLMKGRK